MMASDEEIKRLRKNRFHDSSRAQISPLQFAKPYKRGELRHHDWPGGPETIEEEDSALGSSIDPTLCLMPYQLSGIEYLERRQFADKVLYPPFVHWGFSTMKTDSRELINWYNFENTYLTHSINKQSIGKIYLNVNTLLHKYKSSRYSEENVKNENFNIHGYITDIWDAVNGATGNVHNFKLHTDFDFPHIIRIVDLTFQQEESLLDVPMHVLNIQSNDSVVRDFNYTSNIPSALSATIGIATQNPDNIEDLDGATFAAFTKNIISRFHRPQPPKEKEVPSDEQRTLKSELVDVKKSEYRVCTKALREYVSMVLTGEYQEVGDDGEKTGQEEIGKASATLRRAIRLRMQLSTTHGKDGTYDDGVPFYKGYPIRKDQTANTRSGIIPLKFNCQMDGISGIVIGNMFKVNPTRLPAGYKGETIAFIVTNESQNISDGHRRKYIFKFTIN